MFLFGYQCFLPLFACLILSGLFVGSLYIWVSEHGRNHPSTIRKRFCSVFIVALISPFVLKLFIFSEEFKKFSVLELIGFRLPGIVPATIIPLFLTVVLFVGPLSMLDIVTEWQVFFNLYYWIDNITDLIWIRNIIVGPLSEEFTFRACMMPLLLQCFKPLTAVFVCSLFFGLAHVHHVIERHKAGEELKIIFLGALLQFSYTTLFGGYFAFLFIQTGHFVTPFVVHAFCNAVSFPAFGNIVTFENPKRSIVIFLFFIGVIFWYILLEPLTNHELYHNEIFYKNGVPRH